MSNMEIQYRYEDGTPVPQNICIRPLASRTTLTVVIDSIGGHLSPEAVMRHLKKQWGVREVTITEDVVTCKGFTKNQPVR